MAGIERYYVPMSRGTERGKALPLCGKDVPRPGAAVRSKSLGISPQ